MKKDGKKITIDELAFKTDQGFLKSDKRFDDLIKKMDQGFKEADARTDMKIDELTIMIGRGFNDLTNQLNDFKEEMYSFRDEMYDFRDETKHRLNNIEHELSDIKQHINDIGIRINYIEQKSKEDKKDIISEVSKLKKRINILEKQFAQLKTH